MALQPQDCVPQTIHSRDLLLPTLTQADQRPDGLSERHEADEVLFPGGLTAELHHELVPFDAALAQRMSDRAVRILRATDAGELLPRAAAARDFLDCRFCPYAERCWSLSQ